MPVKGNNLFCPSCNKSQSQINLIDCEYCGHDLGAPNVNIVSTETELTALQGRYDNAMEYAIKSDKVDQLKNFENFFNNNVNGIINLSLHVLEAWIIQSGAYKSYHRAIGDKLRTIAIPSNDQKRTVLNSVIHGTYGRDMIYAALTLNCQGLTSYGNCSVILDEQAIESRATTLEENSYTLIKTHNLNLEKLEIPPGYRSNWQNKIKLAVAKLHKKINQDSNEKDFCEMILFSDGKRNGEDFIEVHVYKEITNFAIKIIYIPKSNNRREELVIKAIEEKCPGKVIRTE